MADSIDLDTLEWGELLAPFTLMLEQREQTRNQLFDTYDWALWRGGLTLLYSNSARRRRSYELWQRDQFLSASPLSIEAVGRKRHRFWWDFSAPEAHEIQQQLKEKIKLRALLEMHQFDLLKSRYAVKNSDQKSVAWIEVITLQSTTPNSEGTAQQRQLVRLIPLRGYEQELKRVQKQVQKLGLTLYSDHLLSEYLTASAVDPLRYQSKPGIAIEPGDAVRDVVLRYLRTLLQVARENEAGIIDDLDIEFLHDYRVSIRRIRSIISLVRNVFTPQETRWLKQSFAAIGKRTNQLRDLDVYLLEHESYRSLVPEILGEGVDTLFASLQQDRKRELSRVRRWLRSAEYGAVVGAIEERLQGDAEALGSGARAGMPVLAVANKEINKKFHKVGKLGCAIDETTPDAEVHDLRLECKKLRYLLEFFGVLYPKKKLRKAVTTLKQLQDNLGRFNDLSVQQESLEAFLSTHQQEQVSMLAAVGGLIGALNLEQRLERGRVSDTFARFYSGETRQLYADIVSQKVTQTEQGGEA